MNKKDYKGYELIKAIHDGEIEDCTTIEVHDLSTLDHIKARITYSNKRLNWIAGDFDTTCLFDDNIYFRVLEDNTEEIEGLNAYKLMEAPYMANKLKEQDYDTFMEHLKQSEVEIANKIIEIIDEVNKMKEKDK